MQSGFQVLNTAGSIIIDETYPNWGLAPTRIDHPAAIEVKGHDGIYQFAPYSALAAYVSRFGVEVFDENAGLNYSSSLPCLSIVGRKIFRVFDENEPDRFTQSHAEKIGLWVLRDQMSLIYMDFYSYSHELYEWASWEFSDPGTVTLVKRSVMGPREQSIGPGAPSRGGDPLLDVFFIDLDYCTPTTGF